MYSNMALSPVASEIDRCTVVNLSVPGIKSETIAKDSFPNSFTASDTVAKLSNTYCAHKEMDIPFMLPSLLNVG